MKTMTKRTFAIAGALALGLGAVKAQTDNALLDALVKKGVLSGKEAKDIRASEEKDYNTTAASKLTMGSYISKITFYGDGRLRFDTLAQHNFQANSQNVQDRFRYRLRFGVDYNYSDNLKAGFELVSSTTDDSGNQTLGATFTNASINVGKIYLQYQPTDWLTLMGGKFANPWYATTDNEYSNDLYPEGIAESFKFQPTDQLSVGLTLTQFDYITSNQSTNTLAPSTLIQNNNNVGIIGAQVPVEWKFMKDMSAKIAPGFTFYTSGGNTNFQGGVPANYTNGGTPAGPNWFYGTSNSSSDPVFYSPREADDLNIFSAPGEFDFKVGKIPVRIYEDFSVNVTGKQRVQDVYLQGGGTYLTAANVSPAPTAAATQKGATVGFGSVPANKTSAASVAAQNKDLGDNVAWATGVQVGQNKKKGDFSILAEFRQIGLGAVDPNINGTDFADSYDNQEGVKTSAVYNFTDFLTGTVTFYDTWAYKSGLYNDLGGASTKATPIPGSPAGGTTQALIDNKSLERVQVDIGWKF